MVTLVLGFQQDTESLRGHTGTKLEAPNPPQFEDVMGATFKVCGVGTGFVSSRAVSSKCLQVPPVMPDLNLPPRSHHHSTANGEDVE